VRVFRLIAAFLLAPWVPVAGYYAYYSALWSSRGGDVPGASAFLAAFAPVAYIATAVVWLPFVLVLRKFGKDRLVPLLAGGTALGAAVAAAGLATGGRPILASESSHFLIVATALGLLFGAAFWAIGVAGPRGDARP
jgi:hypothetical protein